MPVDNPKTHVQERHVEHPKRKTGVTEDVALKARRYSVGTA